MYLSCLGMDSDGRKLKNVLRCDLVSIALIQKVPNLVSNGNQRSVV
jgi:hypothetical protein